MNDTVLALLSALAIYGLANFALPRSGWDTGEGDATTQAEETADLPRADDSQDDGRGLAELAPVRRPFPA